MNITFVNICAILLTLVLWKTSDAASQQTVIRAVAVLAPTGSEQVSGTVTFEQYSNGTRVTVNIEGIVTGPDSEHGIHVHKFGDLRGLVTTPPLPGSSVTGGLSVGAHYDPDGNPHGCPYNTTHHEGDLGNWQAVGGKISLTQWFSWIVIDGTTKSLIGRAVVFHANTDDCVTVASSGSRLAIGVIGISNVPTGTTNTAKPSTGNTEAVCILQGTSHCQGTQCKLGSAGVVTFSSLGGVSVQAQVKGVTTERGFHIHSFGDLTVSDGTSAGGHYNPDGHVHGLPGVTNLRHLGDLGYLNTFSNGDGFYSYTPEYSPITSWTIDNIIGRAIIVHEKIDHGNDSTCGSESLTTGAAGNRIYYCVIGIPNDANQTIPANYLPVPQFPSGITLNNTWYNTPCGPTSPVDLAAKGLTKQQELATSLTFYWKPISETDSNITFALRASTGGWVGVGWTGGPFSMVGSDAVIGWAGASNFIGAFSLTGQDVNLIKPQAIPIYNNYTEEVNGITTIIFTRPLAAGSHPLTTNGENTMIGAVGSTDYLTKHVIHSIDSISIDYVTGQVTITQEVDLEIVHGIIMIIAWSMIIPFGMLFARYGKEIPNEMWFQVHRVVMPTGYIVVWIGFIIALVMVNGDHFDTVWHGQLGITLVLIPVAQIVYGVLRPHRDESTPRAIFEIVHPWFGRILVFVAIIQTYGGLALLGVNGGWIFLYTVWVIALICTTIVLEIRPREKLRNSMADWSEDHCGGVCESCLRPNSVKDY